MKHQLSARLLTKPVNVVLVGAGGTGSHMLNKLVALHRTIRALGHPHGLNVTVIDPDTVSLSNVGRQAFYLGDIGNPKADVLVNRANMSLEGTTWTAIVGKLTTKESLSGADIVIGAVDNRAGRLAILRGLENAMSGVRYWLDIGNRRSDGQVILGQVSAAKLIKDDPMRLPHAAELFPEIIDPTLEVDDDTPSCSLAESIAKQSLYINSTMADAASNLLFDLFTDGFIERHGVFVNLKRSMMNPLLVDPEVWKRFGVVRDGKRHKVVRPSVRAKKAELAPA